MSVSHQIRGRGSAAALAPDRSRRGAALFAVMASLAIVSLIAVGLMRMALVEQQQLRMQQRTMQAERLANAALERAAAALHAAGDYQGETWRTPADEMAGHLPAAVVIRVEAVADRPTARRIVVQADYPDDSAHRARKTSELVVELTRTE